MSTIDETSQNGGGGTGRADGTRCGRQVAKALTANWAPVDESDLDLSEDPDLQGVRAPPLPPPFYFT
eukprot:1045734-Prorocentrum_minimum.AAC.1